jgi:hypothetical protein
MPAAARIPGKKRREPSQKSLAYTDYSYVIVHAERKRTKQAMWTMLPASHKPGASG